MEQCISGFSFADSRVDNTPVKAGCARRAMGNMLGKTKCYTFEISFYN